ncbi:MAG TPA: nucleotidyltransferase domain-containing protein [Solirubrobacterales bacterium]|nr:nucleotidyltransferase domain-containing protein [Solirubrobacterales bacterium]
MLPVASGGGARRYGSAAMDRARYSRDRIEELATGLSSVDGIFAEESLCIYATGSYGRLEAWEGSDIDLFFLAAGHPDERPIPSLRFIRLAARLIELTEEMGFPEFTSDGAYLEVQYVDQMEEVLGSPHDDGLNAFTARMLLLLESRPVYRTELYRELLTRVIGFYFRDLDGHENDFEPVFLSNDILRFWRTLTLNYENKRFRIDRLPGAQQAEARAQSALKNYKLKQSRLATCFSMILHLATDPLPILPTRVLELCELTPQERFAALKGRGDDQADRRIEQLRRMYEAFLERVQTPETPEEELVERFRDSDQRKKLLEEATLFGAEIYFLLQEMTSANRMRRLVV